jgi:riboflavin-specific deaminase-like protein
MKATLKLHPRAAAAARARLPVAGASRPFVFVNMSMTADGKIASANRAVVGFGSARDRRHLYELRATADAVMSGARTIELNRATLGTGGATFRAVRRRRGLAERNLRIVVSGSGSIDPRAPIFHRGTAPLILLTTQRVGAARLARLRALADEVFVAGRREIHWRKVLRWLYQKWRVRRLLCEGGGALNNALFRAGLVDELHLTVCPLILGGRAAPGLAEGQGARRLRDASRWRIVRRRRHGDELFLVLRPVRRQGMVGGRRTGRHQTTSTSAR